MSSIHINTFTFGLRIFRSNYTLNLLLYWKSFVLLVVFIRTHVLVYLLTRLMRLRIYHGGQFHARGPTQSRVYRIICKPSGFSICIVYLGVLARLMSLWLFSARSFVVLVNGWHVKCDIWLAQWKLFFWVKLHHSCFEIYVWYI